MYLALGGRPNFGWFSVDLRWWSYYSANYLIYIIFCCDNNNNEITRTIHTSTIRLIQELWLCFNTDIICLGQGVVNISRVTQQELFEILQSANASCPDIAVTYLREMKLLQWLVGNSIWRQSYLYCCMGWSPGCGCSLRLLITVRGFHHRACCSEKSQL